MDFLRIAKNLLSEAQKRAEWEAANPITLVQGTRPYNIFSSLGEYGLPILDYLTYKDGNALRATCKEACTAVAEYKWMDSETRINRSLKLWRICFPHAKAANIRSQKNLTDADFIYLKGIHILDMSYCMQATITDAAFVHLQGIHTLEMECCNQITDAAFVHLKGIHTLVMGCCYQGTITDAAFAHLKGIHTLDMGYCYQATITDAAFVHLQGIHTLQMNLCTQITDAVFAHLEGIKILYMIGCTGITAPMRTHLQGCHIIH